MATQQKPFVLTISRDFASMGRSIAQKLAAQLAVEFYDRDIVEQTAKRMNLTVSTISDTEEAAKNLYFKRMYPLGMSVKSMQDEVFLVQKNIIEDLAAKESCIIVGRCADEILKNRPNVLSVHIFAPKAARLKNCVELLQMDEDTGKKMIAKVDKSRANYHRVYGGGDVFTNCHLMLNSAEFGIDGTAALLERIVKERFGV